MACYNVFANLSNISESSSDNPFDVFPFFMGDYDTVARSGESSFVISGKYDDHIYSKAQFCFSRHDKGNPFEKNVAINFDRKNASSACISMFIEKEERNDDARLIFNGPNFVFSIRWAEISYIPISTWLSRYVSHGYLPYSGDTSIFSKRKGTPVTSEEIIQFGKFVNFFRSDMPLENSRFFDVRALEPNLPIRRRVYRKTPHYLCDYEKTNQISRVGKTLGIWEQIQVIDIESGSGMEVKISVNGESYNLMDVGYGVHSLLPIVSEISSTGKPSIFLLQQPEIHIHPTAQAELAQYMARGKHEFIIETHSDHLVDRFRLCVLEKILRPEELSILYFEKRKDGTNSNIHSISVDSQANVVNAPDSYREFFLKETERLLGLG